MYITNLKRGFQKDGTKLYNEEGPNNEKPAAKNRHFEEPTLNNLNHVYKLYEESGSDSENITEIVKGENKKNSKERSYSKMDKGKEGKQANIKTTRSTMKFDRMIPSGTSWLIGIKVQ